MALRPDGGSRGEFTQLCELRVVAPYLEGKVAGSIGEGKFHVGRTAFGRLVRAVLDLGVEKRFLGGLIGGLPELRDSNQFHSST